MEYTHSTYLTHQYKAFRKKKHAKIPRSFSVSDKHYSSQEKCKSKSECDTTLYHQNSYYCTLYTHIAGYHVIRHRCYAPIKNVFKFNGYYNKIQSNKCWWRYQETRILVPSSMPIKWYCCCRKQRSHPSKTWPWSWHDILPKVESRNSKNVCVKTAALITTKKWNINQQMRGWIKM